MRTRVRDRAGDPARERGRRAPRGSSSRSLLVSGCLVLLLGALGLLAGHRAQDQAVAVHREDRVELQELLGSLVNQYAMVLAADVDAHGGLRATARQPWGTRPGDPGTTQRLQELLEAARAVDAGVVLVDALGRPLGQVARPGAVLPASSDPGWAALRTAAVAGRLPVSDLLGGVTAPQIAVGVPTTLEGGRTGLLIGIFQARAAGLQKYVGDLPQSVARQGWVLDSRGLVLAGPTPDAIGRPLPLPGAAAQVQAPGGIADTRESGTAWVTSSEPAGTTGWASVTTHEREAFQGALERSGREVQAVLVALLLLSGTCLVVLSRKRESALARVALRDDLTGVWNRRGWFELADGELRRAERAGQRRVLLFVDLDGLKQVNDVLGHRDGDRAITAAAQVLSAAARGRDLVGRLGGDEFVLLLGDEDDAEAARGRLLDALAACNRDSGARWELRLSLGAEVWFPDVACSLDELVRRADAQMYRSKRSRPDRGAGVLRLSQPQPQSEPEPVPTG